MNATPSYVLGHSDPELERLQFQATIIAGITRRLIRESGIGPGMAVLDLGCGAGDVSMLVGEAVGPSGRVLGIDRETRAIETARARAATAGFRQIEFAVTVDDMLPDRPSFDAVIGRYILVHQPDPVAMLRRAAAAVRPGGIVAFHEVALHLDSQTRPVVELFAEVARRIDACFRSQLPHHDAAGCLVEYFAAAGLPAPQLTWEAIAGDHTSPLWRMVAMTYFSLRPQIHGLGLPPLAEDNVDALTARFVDSARALSTQIVSRPQACGWSRRPSAAL